MFIFFRSSLFPFINPLAKLEVIEIWLVKLYPTSIIAGKLTQGVKINPSEFTVDIESGKLLNFCVRFKFPPRIKLV